MQEDMNAKNWAHGASLAIYGPSFVGLHLYRRNSYNLRFSAALRIAAVWAIGTPDSQGRLKSLKRKDVCCIDLVLSWSLVASDPNGSPRFPRLISSLILFLRGVQKYTPGPFGPISSALTVPTPPPISLMKLDFDFYVETGSHAWSVLLYRSSQFVNATLD